MIKLRPATLSDSEMLLAWRNDPATYKYFLVPAPVTPNEHQSWFKSLLESPEIKIVIAEKGPDSIGMLRFDDRNVGMRVAITIAPLFRGQGLGYLILAQATKEYDRPLIAKIHRANIASRRIFERCHFEEVGGDEQFVTYRRDTWES